MNSLLLRLEGRTKVAGEEVALDWGGRVPPPSEPPSPAPRRPQRLCGRQDREGMGLAARHRCL